jgi:hypothetical protein
MQIPGRTSAMTAMTAATIDKLSEGRFRLGVGVSGPGICIIPDPNFTFLVSAAKYASGVTAS